MKVKKFVFSIIVVFICLIFLRNPMWIFDYQECQFVKKIATRDLPALRSWVDFARENYTLSDINSGYWSDEKISWYDSTERTREWLEKNTPFVVFLNINSRERAKTWDEVDLIGLSNGPYQQAYIRYESEDDISNFSEDRRYRVINAESAVYCGSRFLDGD